MSYMNSDEIYRILNLPNNELIQIRNINWFVEKDGWINIQPEYISFCLESLRLIFNSWYGNKNSDKVWFVNKKVDQDVPCAFPKRGIVNLNMNSLTFNDGCQLIYQLAHELTHIYLGRENIYNMNKKHMWFEETICELSSIVALKNPIWNNSIQSSRGFITNVCDANNYADRMITEYTKTMNIRDAKISSIYKLNAENLSLDPYIRELNGLFACKIFNEVNIDYNFWQCIKIFTELDGQVVDILDLFTRWYYVVETKYQSIVAKIISIFGVEIEAQSNVENSLQLNN